VIAQTPDDDLLTVYFTSTRVRRLALEHQRLHETATSLVVTIDLLLNQQRYYPS